ncbi:MAG: aminomethyl transferase family protein [Candidatus Cloacimonetes bacterium]|nr:aminomethyl transferase family protein [Candidatus Cloacimonadota bacterium]
MVKQGFDFPSQPRQTAVSEVEEWYQHLLAERMHREYEPIRRSNFGEYNMAVNYLTSVLEEAAAINNLSIFNIDHMAQLEFSGSDVVLLLDRVLPANVNEMKIGQCKYTLLLNQLGCVVDDLIVMRMSEQRFILVINAGHDITDESHNKVADIDFILSYKLEDEDVIARDISDQLVKIDIQGPLSYKLITSLYGDHVLKNRSNPDKNMRYFTFNEFEFEAENYIISRTGYTSRWGWELYIPVAAAPEQFKRIILAALDLGGLLVGLGGRDENRISAGNFGLPLNGSEYTPDTTPTNCPLFAAAIDMNKESFVGKDILAQEIKAGIDKRLVLFISEGIVTDRGIYKDGVRLGYVTSSINSPNVSQEKREYLGSQRKSVSGEHGTAAIGLGWLQHNPFAIDADGKDILMYGDKAVRIRVEFYREDENGVPKGKPVIGYISGDGVNVATAPKALKNIEK